MRTYDEDEVQKIINNVVKIFDNTKGIRERGIYLTANICPDCIDEEGAMLLMVDIRTGDGLLDVLSPLRQKIRISELLENKTKNNIITNEYADDDDSLDYCLDYLKRVGIIKEKEK